MNTHAYLEILKENIMVWGKFGSKKLVLLWDSSPTYVYNKAKRVLFKEWNWKDRVACKILRFKSNREYLGIVKN